MLKLLSRLDFSYIYALLGEATLGLTFFFYIILARILGPQRYEVFAAAVALAAILSLFIQFGLPTLLTREVAANPETGAKSTIKFLILEALLFIPVLLLLLPIARILGYEGDGLIVCYLIMFAELCRSAKMTLRGVLRGRGWFKAETVSVALERFFVVLLTGIVLILTKNLVLVVGTFALARMLDIVGLVFYLNRKMIIWSPLSLGELARSLYLAYPFALSGVLWILYYQVDVVMLKGIAPAGEAGFYSAAYKVMEIFSALPRVVFYVAFTRFAQHYANNPQRLQEEIYKTTRLLLIVVLPVLLIAGLLETNLVKLIYGEAYLPAVDSLTILLPSIAVQMLGAVANQFLLATNREKDVPAILLGTVVLNIGVNFILIPIMGAKGAAIATLLSEVVLTTMSLRLMINAGHKHEGNRIQQIVFISLIVTAIPFLTLKGLPVIAGIGLMLPEIAAIAFLMQRSRFFQQTEQV